MHTFTEDKVFADLLETVEAAIQDCIAELGYVDYVKFIERWQEVNMNALMEKYAKIDSYAVLFSPGRNAYNFGRDQWKGATVRIDGYTFNLENVFNEAAKDYWRRNDQQRVTYC